MLAREILLCRSGMEANACVASCTEIQSILTSKALQPQCSEYKKPPSWAPAPGSADCRHLANAGIPTPFSTFPARADIRGTNKGLIFASAVRNRIACIGLEAQTAPALFFKPELALYNRRKLDDDLSKLKDCDPTVEAAVENREIKFAL